MSMSGGIELHYYLEGGAHSMDAVVHNRCEAELLALFQEVASALGVPTSIESQALTEGGIKEVWKWLGENGVQISVCLSVVAMLISLTPQVYQSDEERLNEELTELRIKEKQLQIEKLKKDLQKAEPGSKGAIQHDAVHLLLREPKVIVRRSNL